MHKTEIGTCPTCGGLLAPGNPLQVRGQPGELVYQKYTTVSILQVRVVCKDGSLLLSGDVHHGEVGKRQRISSADLEGWTHVGTLDSNGVARRVEQGAS